jgi:hypothetical protein
MKLFEFDQDDLQTGFYDPAEDKLTARNLSDTRRPQVTLRKINKLKKMRALKKLEDLKRQDLLQIMYGGPANGGDDGGLGGGVGGF